jgi:hypothetical protein
VQLARRRAQVLSGFDASSLTGDCSKTDGVRGGLEWRVAFLENPGSYDGYTYPPGAGNLDFITYDTSSLQGTTPAVVNEVLRTGSTPFSGTFSVAFNGAKTEEMERQEATDEVEYVIEKLDTIGEIRVDRTDMGLQRIPGVAATIGRDGSSASLVYDASFGDSYDRETSLMDYLAPGEVFRLGGVDGGIYSSHAGKVDGSEMLGSLLDYSENAPVVGTPQERLSAMLSYALVCFEEPARACAVAASAPCSSRSTSMLNRVEASRPRAVGSPRRGVSDYPRLSLWRASRVRFGGPPWRGASTSRERDPPNFKIL